MSHVEITKETVLTINGNPYSEEEAFEIYSALKEHFEPKDVKKEESPFKKILEEMEKNREKEKAIPSIPWPEPPRPYPWEIKPYPLPWEDPYRPYFTTSNKTTLMDEHQKKPRGLRF